LAAAMFALSGFRIWAAGKFGVHGGK
jgi:hypothetical protein